MIHKYSLNGYNIILDVYSGAVHVVDDLTYRLVDFTDENMTEQTPAEAYDALSEYSREDIDSAYAELYEERPYLTLNQWSVADVDGDPSQCGLAGSPTKVKSVQNIVFQAKECKHLTASDADIEGMIKELLDEKIIG